jgi:hypothetical protein
MLHCRFTFPFQTFALLVHSAAAGAARPLERLGACAIHGLSRRQGSLRDRGCAAGGGGRLPAAVTIDGKKHDFAELLEEMAEDVPGTVSIDTMPRNCCEDLRLPQGSEFQQGAKAALRILRAQRSGG